MCVRECGDEINFQISVCYVAEHLIGGQLHDAYAFSEQVDAKEEEE